MLELCKSRGETMEEDRSFTLQCNNKLKSKLYSDDTEKLRRKLAYLQREYLKTQQRLKRAERSDIVKKHVRSRITEQNSLLLPQIDPDTSPTCPNVDPCSQSDRLGPPASQTTDPPQDQYHTEGHVVADDGEKSTAVRFLLPSEAAPPLTPACSQDDQARDRRLAPTPSSGLRLRSRSSRLRWQQRCSESAEERLAPGRKPEENSAGIPEVVAETQEMDKRRLSGSESESPSLLLTHWNTERQAAEGRAETKGQVQREKETDWTGDNGDSESPSLLLPHWTPAPPAGRGTREEAVNHEGMEGESRGRLEVGVHAGEQQRHDQRETNCCQNSDGYEEGRAKGNQTASGPRVDQHVARCGQVEGQCDGGVSLRASRTVEEGLLFPPEYYVRTTRHMTNSRQQPDMQSSLFSNLIGTSRPRGRGRGRGRGRNLHPLQDKRQTQHIGKDVDDSNQTGAYLDPPAQMVPSSSSHEAQCSSEKASDQSLDSQSQACLAVPSSRPTRGRKKRRGQPRGRRFDKGCLYSDVSLMDQEETSDQSVPALSSASPSHSSPVAGSLGQGLVSVAPARVSQPSAFPPTLTPGVRPPTQHGGATSSPVPGSAEQFFPIFKRSSSVAERPPHDVSGWRSLLLPSPPAPSDPVLCPPLLALDLALQPLFTLDFHLPDEQFGSLKLHKLQQVIDATTEPFSAPSYHTRRSSQQAYHRYTAGGDQALALSLPFSPTSTATLSMSLLSPDDGLPPHQLSANLPCPSASTQDDFTGGDERIDALMFPESIPITFLDECKAETGDQLPIGGGQLVKRPEQGSSGSPTGRPTEQGVDQSVEREPASGMVSEGFPEQLLLARSPVSTEHQQQGGGEAELSEDVRATDHQRAVEEPTQSPVKCNSKHPALPEVHEEQRGTFVTNPSLTAHHTANSHTEGSAGDPPLHPGACSQLLLSPSLVSPARPLLAPHVLPSALPSSPPLPSLGLSPHPHPALASRLPLTSSPCAPNLTLPSPMSPSTVPLSPPRLSPCTFPVSPLASRQASGSLDPPVGVGVGVGVGGRGQRDGPGRCASAVGACGPDVSQPPRAAGGPEGSAPPRDASSRREGAVQDAGETEVVAEEEGAVIFTHTLTAPAGGGLVDACCVSGPSGSLCVAAAGKWAVCVWDQTPTSRWGLIHTWTFREPVISVFPVPDSVGLLCVTLGQLEIREVRVLSCSSLVEALLCQGVVQAVVGVARSRVVSSSHSAAISTLRLFMLPQDNSASSPLRLAPPGVHVEALATVDGLEDALLGSAKGGHLFLWNLGTGQLLRRIQLDEGLAHTSCLRGYSYSGALFVLLQHQYLGSIVREEVQPYHQEDEHAPPSGEMGDEKPKSTLFSLVAINALSGKSVVANQLHQPAAWTGRPCEADVLGSRLVALSQSGSLHVWDLGGPEGPRVAWAPEADGWHVARWGASDVLVTGHHNGDLTLYRYVDRQDSAKTDV